MTAAWRSTFYAFEYADEDKIIFTVTRDAYADLPAGLIRDALDERGIPPIPADVINPPRRPEPEWRPLPLDELIAIFDGRDPNGGQQG